MSEGEFNRDTRYLDGRITADGRDGWAVEPGRYRLAVAAPTHDERSGTFDLDPDGRDPVLGIERLADAHQKAVPGCDRGVTVPGIVDIPSGAVVTNDGPMITVGMETEWTALHRPGAPDRYPDDRRDEIEEVAALVFRDVNNGVYRTGFATSQQAYKCNRQKPTEMPVLSAYATDLFQTPGFGDTIDFQEIRRPDYVVHTGVNPTGIVPVGPDPSGWTAPHGREALGGRPFGDGTPPGPPPPDEVVRPAHQGA